jgi:hypothetical protein
MSGPFRRQPNLFLATRLLSLATPGLEYINQQNSLHSIHSFNTQSFTLTLVHKYYAPWLSGQVVPFFLPTSLVRMMQE